MRRTLHLIIFQLFQMLILWGQGIGLGMVLLGVFPQVNLHLCSFVIQFKKWDYELWWINLKTQLETIHPSTRWYCLQYIVFLIRNEFKRNPRGWIRTALATHRKT